MVLLNVIAATIIVADIALLVILVVMLFDLWKE